MKKSKDIFSVNGYKSNSKDKNKPKNVIPSGRITMKDVPHPVYGVDDMGNEMMMYPGNEYLFPGNTVTEYPIKQQGGSVNSNNKVKPKVRYTDESKFNNANSAYSDSLNLYNAYIYGRDNFNPDPKLQELIDFDNKHRGPLKGMTIEQVKKMDQEEYGGVNTPKPLPGMYKIAKSNPLSKYSPLDERLGDKEIYNYYKSLKFNQPVVMDPSSSPAIWHKNIKPTELYFNGLSHSPVYKEPTVEPTFDPYIEPLTPKKINSISHTNDIPTPMQDKSNPGPNEVVLPGSNLEWVQSPSGTWHQIERRSNGPIYNLKTGSTHHMQVGGQTPTQPAQVPNPYYQQQLNLYNQYSNPSKFTDVNDYQVLEGDELNDWYNTQVKNNPSLTQENGTFAGGYKPNKVYVNQKDDRYYQTYNKPSRTIPKPPDPTVPIEVKAGTPPSDPNGWKTATIISLKKSDGTSQNVYVPFGSKYPKSGYSYDQFIKENGELGEYNNVPSNIKSTNSGGFQTAVTPVPFPENYGENSQYMQYARKLRELKLKELQQKATTTSMSKGGEANSNNWDPSFYQEKKEGFMDWIKTSAIINSEETHDYLKQVGGVINSRAYNVGKVYSSPFDQPISPDIYNDQQINDKNTIINDTDYGRKQATIDYTTTGIRSKQFGQPDLNSDQGIQVPGTPTSAVNWNYSPTPSLDNNYQSQTIDPNVDPIASSEQIMIDSGRATFDRNKPLEKDLHRQQREDRKNSVSGQTKANILLSGLNFVNNLAGQDERKRYEQQMQRQYSAENLYDPVSGSRGDYLLNSQGSNFRPNDYTFGDFGKVYREGGIHIDSSNKGTFKAQASRMGMSVQEAASKILDSPKGTYSPEMRKKANFAKNFAKKYGGEYKAGGEYEMSDRELQDFIDNGGEVDYLD